MRLLEILRALETDIEDLKLLGEMNRMLVTTILDTEKDVLATKARLKKQKALLRASRPTKERARSLKARIEALRE